MPSLQRSIDLAGCGHATARVPLLPAAKRRAEGPRSPRAAARKGRARRGDREPANPRDSRTVPSLAAGFNLAFK